MSSLDGEDYSEIAVIEEVYKLGGEEDQYNIPAHTAHRLAYVFGDMFVILDCSHYYAIHEPRYKEHEQDTDDNAVKEGGVKYRPGVWIAENAVLWYHGKSQGDNCNQESYPGPSQSLFLSLC